MSSEPSRSRAIDWPAEWARDEKFWREVATRTIAGVLTLVFIGVPTIIYLLISGGMRASIGIPILIGIAIALLAFTLWFLIRWGIRVISRGRQRRAVQADPAAGRLTRSEAETIADAFARWVEDANGVAGSTLTIEQPNSKVTFRMSDDTRRHLARIRSTSSFATKWAPLLAGAAATAAGAGVVLELFR